MIKSLYTNKGLVWGGMAVVLALFVTAFTIETAHAQERRSLFDLLFGRKHPKATQPARPQRQRTLRYRQPQHRATQTPLQPQASQNAPVSVQKSNTAKRVLVIGDFVASATAEGLTQAYKDNPDVMIISRTEGSSGLVRDDYYNWPVKISDILVKEKPNIIVLVIGSNDRQTMRVAGKNFDSTTKEWAANYQGRVNTLTQKLQQSGASWVWLGLPSFQKQILNESALTFNLWFKQAAEKSGGHFIDIWGGFIDGNGHFAFSGYDINGQMARLRNNDGISFTQAGKRKLAFYAEQAITTLLSSQQPSGNAATRPATASANPGIERIAPTGLWDLSGGQTVLNGGITIKPAPGTAKPQNETGWRPQGGRADDFSLGGHGGQ